MEIRGLTPVVEIAGRKFQFDLRPRDTLAWQAIDQLNRNQFVELLAVCPELLVCCLTSITADECHELAIDDLFAAAAQLRSESQPAEATSTGSFVVFDNGGKKQYQAAMAALATSVHSAGLGDSAASDSCADREEKAGKVQAVLTKLVNDSCQLDLHGGNESSEPWQLVHDLPAGLWLQLAYAIGKDSDQAGDEAPSPIRVEVGSRSKTSKPAGEDSEFERRLHLAKMASMKQLAYGASHEINNPLANIASRAQTLLMDEQDPGRRLKLAKINEQAFRAHEMIADMMLFAHPPQPDFAEADPLEIVRQVVSEMQPLAESQQTTIKLREGKVPAGILDGTQLAVAVKALVQNSLESLQDSGAIDVELASPQPAVLAVTVSDNGPGISQESLPHLFDPFYSGREAGRGLGFGLSKVWRIAELHGGEISAESPAHGGARFLLRIPYRDVA